MTFWLYSVSILGKQGLFIECLRKKIKSWYETMTPIPWKKSCKWTSSELFITCGLILTGSKSKLKKSDIDPECKLQYTDIFTDDRLKSETRIIIEGDPGSGKTMLSSQLAYDWSMGNISDVNMVILLPLRFVEEDMTIIEAIEKFYVPKDQTLNADDIKALLNQASDEGKTCIVLDGLEEYNGRTRDGEPSEVVRVMRKEKLANCTVVLTSRSDFVYDLPECPMLRLGQFGEEERDLYIAKIIPDNKEKQLAVKSTIQNTVFLLDLCSTPLLFVFVVHNMEQLVQLQTTGQQERVGPFMEAMVNTLLSQAKPVGTEDVENVVQSARLSEIAFNGLCGGHQQLLWQKSFLEKSVSNMKEWIESGILVVEEGLMVGGEKQENNEVETKEDKSTSGVIGKGEREPPGNETRQDKERKGEETRQDKERKGEETRQDKERKGEESWLTSASGGGEQYATGHSDEELGVSGKRESWIETAARGQEQDLVIISSDEESVYEIEQDTKLYEPIPTDEVREIQFRATKPARYAINKQHENRINAI